MVIEAEQEPDADGAGGSKYVVDALKRPIVEDTHWILYGRRADATLPIIECKDTHDLDCESELGKEYF